MLRRRMNPLGAILIAALLLAPMIVLSLSGGGHPEAIMPSEPGAATAPPSASAHRDDVAWWRLETEITGRFQTVQIGTLAQGKTASVDLRTRPIPANAGQVARPWPRVLGPLSGAVILLEEDGAESILTAVTAATGEARELYRTTDLILDAALAGDDLFFVTVNELDGAPIGVWRMPIAGGNAEPIGGLIAARPELVTVAVVEWITQLLVSADGGTVAIHRCVRLECELRGLETATGETWSIPVDFASGPVAIVGGFVVLAPTCVEIDCNLELLDVQSGALRPAPGSPQRQLFEAAIVEAPRPMIVTMLSGDVVGPGREPVKLELLDLRSMTFAPLTVDLGSLAFLGRFGFGAGMELDAGTLLVTGGEWGDQRVGYYVIDLETGEATPVPILGEVVVQG